METFIEVNIEKQIFFSFNQAESDYLHCCISFLCYRYRKNLRRIEEGLENPGLIVPPGDQVYPRENRQPPIPVPSDMVLFCRRVYDYRGKKLVKNPG